jgi:hypothetical protein
VTVIIRRGVKAPGIIKAVGAKRRKWVITKPKTYSNPDVGRPVNITDAAPVKAPMYATLSRSAECHTNDK